MRSKIVDVIILIVSIFLIIGLVLILLGSIKYWTAYFITINNTSQRLFYGGLLIAIVWGVMLFIQGYIREFAKAYRHLFYKNKGGK